MSSEFSPFTCVEWKWDGIDLGWKKEESADRGCFFSVLCGCVGVAFNVFGHTHTHPPHTTLPHTHTYTSPPTHTYFFIIYSWLVNIFQYPWSYSRWWNGKWSDYGDGGDVWWVWLYLCVVIEIWRCRKGTSKLISLRMCDVIMVMRWCRRLVTVVEISTGSADTHDGWEVNKVKEKLPLTV